MLLAISPCTWLSHAPSTLSQSDSHGRIPRPQRYRPRLQYGSVRRPWVSRVRAGSLVCMLQVHTPGVPRGSHHGGPRGAAFSLSRGDRRPHITGISRLFSFHWCCGLQTSCLRFTTFVPRVIRMASIRFFPTSFLLVSQVLHSHKTRFPVGG